MKKQKIYDYFRVVKITMVAITILVILLTIYNQIYSHSIFLQHFILGALFVEIITLIVVDLAYGHNLKIERKVKNEKRN